MNTKTRISPETARKRHRIRVIVAMSLYIVVLLTCTRYLKTTPPGMLQVVLALLPTLPVIWVMASLVTFLRQTDELQRRVHLEALSVAAGVTAFLSLTYGFLEQFAGFPHLAAWWTFVVIDMVWGAYACVLWHRYK